MKYSDPFRLQMEVLLHPSARFETRQSRENFLTDLHDPTKKSSRLSVTAVSLP
jgi:hypothetical protein